VAALGDSSAIVCFRDHGSSRNDNSGMCQHISMSGASITSGGNLVIAEWYPGIYSGSRSGSVAALDSSTAVVCYSDKGSTPTANAGTCKKLSVSAMSATSLTAGAGTVFASTGARDVNVVALDATNAIVCYNNLGNDEHGTCNHLGVSSTGTIVAGTAVEFVPTSNVYDISLTKQSASTALVCYRVNSMPSGVCKPLSVSGTSITVGADIVFFSGYMGNRPATTGVTATKALVCYGGDDNKGTCNLIASPPPPEPSPPPPNPSPPPPTPSPPPPEPSPPPPVPSPPPPSCSLTLYSDLDYQGQAVTFNSASDNSVCGTCCNIWSCGQNWQNDAISSLVLTGTGCSVEINEHDCTGTPWGGANGSRKTVAEGSYPAMPGIGDNTLSTFRISCP